MPVPFRLCAIDLDDTLLAPDHTISPRNARAVQAVAALGVTVVVASGRMHVTAGRYAADLGLNAPVISYNGALVKHALTNEIWRHDPVPQEFVGPLLDYSQERNLQLNFYADDVAYTARETEWSRLYRERTQAPYVVRPDFYTGLRDVAPTKLLIVDTPELTNARLAHFEKLWGDRLYLTKSAEEYLEFLSPTATKGTALAYVAQRLGVPPEATLAFGDSYNDAPMFRWAGTGLAVGNAKPELIQAASRVIGRSDEDGVGIALEEIFQLFPGI